MTTLHKYFWSVVLASTIALANPPAIRNSISISKNAGGVKLDIVTVEAWELYASYDLTNWFRMSYAPKPTKSDVILYSIIDQDWQPNKFYRLVTIGTNSLPLPDPRPQEPDLRF